MYGPNVAMSQAVHWIKTELAEVRRDVTMLKQRVDTPQDAVLPMIQRSHKPLPMPLLAPLPLSLPVHSVAPAREAVDIHALRMSIELGLKANVRATMLTDLKQGMKEERNLIESSLMIRYDSMVSRMVGEQMSSVMDQMRVFVEDTIAAAFTERMAMDTSATATGIESLDPVIVATAVPFPPIESTIESSVSSEEADVMLESEAATPVMVTTTPLPPQLANKVTSKRAARSKRLQEAAKGLNTLDLPLSDDSGSGSSSVINTEDREISGEPLDSVLEPPADS